MRARPSRWRSCSSRALLRSDLWNPEKYRDPSSVEREAHALRLCPDEWLAALCGPARSKHLDDLRGPVEALQRDVAARALELGVNVALENGFWSRAERDDYRASAHSVGARVELHYLHVSRDELWSRVARRNAALPAGSFHVDEHELDLWLSQFEAPTADELMPEQR